MKAAFVLGCSLAVGVCGATPFSNGSFETGPAPGAYLTLVGGSTAINGWTVGGAGVDYIDSFWIAADGTRSLDLSAVAPGSISQTFDTVVGQYYAILFDMAGNPDTSSPIKSMTVQATGGPTTTYSFDTTGFSTSNMGWAIQVYSFVASSTSTTLTFTSLEDSPYGPALDNVSVTLSPEPSTALLMAAGALAAGLRSRFRRT